MESMRITHIKIDLRIQTFLSFRFKNVTNDQRIPNVCFNFNHFEGNHDEKDWSTEDVIIVF